uniref:Protein phosphatase 1 regulatory subunit 21 N-terminal domain-containing protein n=1 Tax=Acrobeloides nanus TaxID=290746 RepID=A0A914D4C8_9BILA
LRNQVPVLKNAVVEKQSENEKLKEEVQSKETSLRKLRSENESLAFRNDQLLKRIEALQQTLDDTNAAFNSAKNKKKHKEANLRLFGESSRLQPSTSDTQTVLEQELERKLLENGELHSKLFDLERQNESIVADLTQRISALEQENVRLKSSIVHENTRETMARTSRHTHKSSDQQSDYYSDENPKEHLDAQIFEMPQEIITPQDEAKLYANGLLTSTKNVIDSFVNLFTLFEQRCNIYPCDITLETLPSSIVK